MGCELVLDAVERDRAGDEAEGLAGGAVAADVDVDGEVGGVDDVDLAGVDAGGLAEEVVDVTGVPSPGCDQF